jgi:hypothetical protein
LCSLRDFHLCAVLRSWRLLVEERNVVGFLARGKTFQAVPDMYYLLHHAFKTLLTYDISKSNLNGHHLEATELTNVLNLVHASLVEYRCFKNIQLSK